MGDRFFWVLFSRWLTAIFLGIIVCRLLAWGPVALARSETVVVNMTIFDQFIDRSLIAQAEALASQEVGRHFGQDPGISTIEITILGDSNGEIAPIVTATVSRNQWAEDPTIGPWMTHYDAAYQLFQRHGDSRYGIIAGIPYQSTVSRNSRLGSNRSTSSSRKPAGPLLPWQVAEAYDSGRLLESEIQRYIDVLD
ncbi:hypothetical protein C7271_12505 [filamentous cyanobacterium CCP5]|nr:hypothetical protein C7271_12505 [filamentous cyanobacterium CCP5]